MKTVVMIMLTTITTLLMLLSVSGDGGGATFQPVSYIPRPDPENAALFARWLISHSYWGVLTTLDSDKTPFGNILSFADNNTGVPYFYNSKTLDKSGRNAVDDPRASFTVTEYVLGYCAGNDPQYPACAKLTLSGKLVILNKTTEEGSAGEALLINRHPQFAGFPKMKIFDVFKLLIETIYLVNKLEKERNLTVSDYLNVKLI